MTTNFVLPYNDKALRGQETYLCSRPINIGNQVFVRYALIDTEPATISRAVEAVQALLRDNPNLCVVFPMENLREKISRKPYLIINGSAVCLSKYLEETNRDYKDRFTLGPVKHPVRCSQNHVLEHKLAQIWTQKKGNICIIGNHTIGPLEIDPILESDAAANRKGAQKYAEQTNFRLRQDQLTKLQSRIKEIVGRLIRERTAITIGVEAVELYRGAQVAEEAAEKVVKKAAEAVKGVAKIAKKVAGEVVEKAAGKAAEEAVEKGAVKVVEKVAETVVEKAVGKATEEAVEKGAAKVVEKVAETVVEKGGTKVAAKSGATLIKFLPIVGLAISSVQAYRRYQQGQYWRCGGEIASGTIGAFFSGPGTVVAFGLDAVMLSVDIGEIVNSPSAQAATNPNITKIQFDLSGAYQVLGIKPNPDPVVGRREVDKAFLLLNQPVDPADIGAGFLQELVNECAPALMHAREVIYQERGWS